MVSDPLIRTLAALASLLICSLMVVIIFESEEYSCPELSVDLYDIEKIREKEYLTEEEFNALSEEIDNNYRNIEQLMLEKMGDCINSPSEEPRGNQRGQTLSYPREIAFETNRITSIRMALT